MQAEFIEIFTNLFNEIWLVKLLYDYNNTCYLVCCYSYLLSYFSIYECGNLTVRMLSPKNLSKVNLPKKHTYYLLHIDRIVEDVIFGLIYYIDINLSKYIHRKENGIVTNIDENKLYELPMSLRCFDEYM